MDALTQYINLYRDHSATVMEHAPEALNRPRPAAFKALIDARLPRKGDEGYPALSVEDMFAPNYGVNIGRVPVELDAASSFKCGVPNVSSLLALVVNDTFVPTQSLQRNLPQGVTVMSLARAAQEKPELVSRYYDSLASTVPSTVSRLNTLLAQDGVMVHVEAGVQLDKPIQILDIFNASQPLMGVRRLLIVVEEGAKAQVLLCDHSTCSDVPYLSCQVAEAFVGQGAQLDIYELEESSALTSRHAQLFARQEADSQLVVNGTTLRGGNTRNAYWIDVSGEHATTKLAGMAIASDSQIIDNTTRVMHNVPKCESEQMFKYILDDKAKGEFYGLIVVDEKAKFTKAYQSNRNILASTDARMHTRPQLEIYCDEVKCSHGATVGQLDANALFYMRTRGIPEQQAKLMLMQAFMADVIDTVRIDALKARLQQLIERRLLGHPDQCGDCKIK